MTDDLDIIREVCVAQIADGLTPRDLASVTRQLVGVLKTQEDRRPPSGESWIEWFRRRVDELGESYGTGDDIEREWLAAHPEPPRPTPRGTPAPFPTDNATDPDPDEETP